MGQQHRKIVKRRRRIGYLERKKALVAVATTPVAPIRKPARAASKKAPTKEVVAKSEPAAAADSNA